jgi:hypothetical protein
MIGIGSTVLSKFNMAPIRFKLALSCTGRDTAREEVTSLKKSFTEKYVRLHDFFQIFLAGEPCFFFLLFREGGPGL